MTPTEAILRTTLQTIWNIREEKQEAAREKRLLDTIALDDERARWEQFAPVVQRNSGRVDVEYREIQ